MRSVARDDRPREKLDRVGASSLGDNELLAVILGHGGVSGDALALANAIIARAGTLRGLLGVSRAELCQTAGVGPARAAQILAAVELGRRTLRPGSFERLQFRSPRQLATWLVPEYGAHPVERFGVVLLDARNQWLATRIISSGTLTSSPAHPRDVFREAVAIRAAAVVLFHNHPSGDPSPSEEDEALTGQLTAAADILGIGVLDHLILAAGAYYSFKEHDHGP